MCAQLGSSPRPIICFVGKNPPNSTSGILFVASVAGNQVYVEMHYRLACRLAIVDADIEAARVVARNQFATTPIEQRKEFISLFHRSLEERRDMAPWDYQRVTRRHGIAVGDGDAKCAALQDALP